MQRFATVQVSILVLLCGLAASAGAAQPKARQARAQNADPRWRLDIPDVPRDEIICFTLYTVSQGVLKLTAVFYPLEEGEEPKATLEVEKDGVWTKVAEAPIESAGWLALFRVEGWDSTKSVRYRVRHAGGASYGGTIRRDPVEKDEIVVAFFTGNSNSDRGPREDIVRNIQAQDPDILFFSGDQSYDHQRHTDAWLLFGRQFGEIIKDRPTISIPDDHDVGHGNLWGEAGGVSKRAAADDGGYRNPPSYVNMVQRAQTGHLPDPYDPTPVKQGITVYYTSLNVGGIDFAVIEDRKWKTGPYGLIPQQGPRPDHINDPTYDPQTLDLPEAILLGDRQLRFLHEWGQDWTGAEMKAVLSQTIFAGGAHLHGGIRNRLVADMDSNGWPQSGRARALREIRRCFALMLGGDQHLATVIHHGINEWEDSGISFGCPSVWNYYNRWWWPLEEPVSRDPNNPLEFSGRYYDGFRNKVTMQAYANPTSENHRAAGYGLVRFKKSIREMTLECWPRFVDVTSPDAKQYTGWPITIRQDDNYARRPMAWLPRISVKGQESPVVQVVDEDSGEIVYTLRIRGTSYRPRVFKEGTYTIRVGEGARGKVLRGVESVGEDDAATLEVEL